jgi:ammonium transporter, Amt family
MLKCILSIFLLTTFINSEEQKKPDEILNDRIILLEEGIKKLEEQNKLQIEETKTLREETNLFWICISAFLVFFMQAGFAFVEAGFTRAKNAVNILMKNLSDFTLGSVCFFLVGFTIMFGPQIFESFGLGKIHLLEHTLLSEEGKPFAAKYGFFLFQLVFAATATTIVSGAMAERTKFVSYLIYSVLMTSIIYPIFGSLAWSNLFDPNNQGYLVKLGFIDFAGSTVVHSVGGWAGLAGTMILKPRLGRYQKGTIIPILGHNMSLATLGVFILWLGWFGFNAGSTGVINGGNFAIIALNTNMSACAGAISSMFLSWILFKKPDIGITLNGGLAGLVAITAGCNNVSITSSLVIGFTAGIIVVGSVLLLDKLVIDDPVGAISVHGVCGAFGTLSVGIFANSKFGGGPNGLIHGGGFSLLGVQAIGVCIAAAWAFSTSFLVFFIMHKTIGLRVTEDEEIIGLDLLEHGNEAYPDYKN